MNMHRHLLALSPISPIQYSAARQLWRSYRALHGMAGCPPISALGKNAKTSKNALPTVTVSLSAANSGGHNVCDASTTGCREGCVSKEGRGGAPSVRKGRAIRTQFLYDHPAAFITLVEHELRAAVAKFGPIACRLNTYSDLRWETIAPQLFDLAEVTFYDYTKLWDRPINPRPNYHLTFSASERTCDFKICQKVASGATVAVVLETKYKPGAKVQAPLPSTYAGCPVVDGDATDERFGEHGVIVGLRAKGQAQLMAAGEREFVKAAQ
jgi:hypothetical protein